jgi:hypothetical protein
MESKTESKIKKFFLHLFWHPKIRTRKFVARFWTQKGRKILPAEFSRADGCIKNLYAAGVFETPDRFFFGQATGTRAFIFFCTREKKVEKGKEIFPFTLPFFEQKQAMTILNCCFFEMRNGVLGG